MQVNVTPDVGFAVVRGIGQHVEATVEPEMGSAKNHKGDHPVYRLVTLNGADGKTLIHSSPGNADIVTVQGTVKRINYARDGAPNGVILESGEFIYLKPEGMKRIELKPGEQVTAEGTAALMPLGQQVIEAKTVNGKAVMAKTRGPASHRAQRLNRRSRHLGARVRSMADHGDTVDRSRRDPAECGSALLSCSFESTTRAFASDAHGAPAVP